jgi:hypothetical protein
MAMFVKEGKGECGYSEGKSRCHVLREKGDMATVRVCKNVMLLREKEKRLCSSHLRRINVTVISLSLTLIMIILGPNRRKPSSKIYAPLNGSMDVSVFS